MLSIYYLWHTENNHKIRLEISTRLWFAFNLLSLTYWKQRKTIEDKMREGCDLLSIYYLWHTENNWILVIAMPVPVVICFQSIIFDILKTTSSPELPVQPGLWFAFNLLSLTYWKQPSFCPFTGAGCCDLLSIYYLWHTENNRLKERGKPSLLWFAFNLLSLTYWKQPSIVSLSASSSCDLLSIYYLWHTENNWLCAIDCGSVLNVCN